MWDRSCKYILAVDKILTIAWRNCVFEISSLSVNLKPSGDLSTPILKECLTFTTTQCGGHKNNSVDASSRTFTQCDLGFNVSRISEHNVISLNLIDINNKIISPGRIVARFVATEWSRKSMYSLIIFFCERPLHAVDISTIIY